MSYVFTASERTQIQTAIDASTGLIFNPAKNEYEPNPAVGSNAVPLYQTLSDIIGAHINGGVISGTDLADLNNAKLWLDVAIGANGNTGMHAAFIRAYTNRQGELRLGHAFSESEMQVASNAVAANFANSLRAGDAESGLPSWNLPRIDQIAKIDASAIGQELFEQPLGQDDSSVKFNAAWSGALGFNLLGGASPFESWRLIQAGDTGSATPNTLDDFKNLLFAVDAYNKALVAGQVRFGFDLADALYEFALRTYEIGEAESLATLQAQLAIGKSSGNWSGAINEIASRTPAIAPVVKLITDVGVNHFLDMLLGAQLGRPVFGSTTDANFAASARTYFGALTPAQIQSLSAELMPAIPAAMVSKAQTDVNARAALAALSSVSVQISPAVAADLDLYDPATGSGELTDQYLKDRARMLSWKMLYDSGARDSDGAADDFFRIGNKPYGQDWDSETIVGNYDFIDLGIVIDGDPLKLAIDGKDITFSDHQIVFGSINADALDGSGDRDNLYGMAGADTLTGNGGNDYLEGGAGNDTYLINPGDGYDTVLDSDGSGSLVFNGIQAQGSATAGLAPADWIKRGDNNYADTHNGISYLRTVVGGETRLYLSQGDTTVFVKGWSDGELGINLGAGGTPVAPPTVLTGTALNNYLASDSGGQRVEGLTGRDMILGVADTDRLLGGDDNDWMVGNGGADQIEGGLGNDYIVEFGAGSQISGGDGNDIINALEGITTYTVASPISASESWADFSQFLAPQAIGAFPPDGSDTLISLIGGLADGTYSGPSAKGGGWTYQFSFVTTPDGSLGSENSDALTGKAKAESSCAAWKEAA